MAEDNKQQTIALQSLRNEIDQIDSQIKDLLLKRFQVVSHVQNLKAKFKLPILDKDRENRQAKMLGEGLSEESANKLLQIFSEIRKQSKISQLSPGTSDIQGRVGIIGMGLMGGSLYKAIQLHHPDIQLYAWDREPDKLWPMAKLEDVLSCDYIFIATPVEAIKRFITKQKNNISENSCFIDLGSTKASIVTLIDTFKDKKWQYIPAHPLVGKDSSGFSNAEACLYHGKTLVICDKTTFSEDTKLNNILSGIGFHFLFMSPEEHDENLALTSHLPHLLSLALIHSLTTEISKEMIPQSFKDMTRIAAANAPMWEDIFNNNKDALLRANSNFFKKINHFIENMSQISQSFHEAKQIRKEFCDDHSYEIVPQRKES